METMQLRMPHEMATFVRQTTRESELQRNAMILYPFIADQTISYGRAAEILGINKWSLIEIFAKVGIPYINLSYEEIDEELETFDKLTAK